MAAAISQKARLAMGPSTLFTKCHFFIHFFSLPINGLATATEASQLWALPVSPAFSLVPNIKMVPFLPRIEIHHCRPSAP